MAFYQKLAANTLYQVIARVFSSGATFLVTILVARHFGLTPYGDFAKVTAFVSLFYLFADFGFNAMFLQKDHSTEHFHDLFYTRIILAVLLVAIVNAITFVLPYNATTGIGFSPMVRLSIAFFSLTILTESMLYSAFAVFQRRYIYQKFMWATIIGSLTTLFFVCLFLLIHATLFWTFIAFIVGAVVEAVLSITFTEEKLLPVVFHVRFAKELFLETIPVASMLIFNLVYFNIDTFLLSLFRPSADVGIYNLAYSVFNFLIALPLFLSNVLYPKLIVDEKNNRNEIRIVLMYVFRFFSLGIITAIIFYFLAPFIFYLIQPSLLPAVLPLRILLLSLPVFFATNILQWILLSKKQQTFLAWIYFSLMILNIVLNLLLIPHFGYIASAIITDAGEFIVLVLFLLKLL